VKSSVRPMPCRSTRMDCADPASASR
jgi:hypothetical protein